MSSHFVEAAGLSDAWVQASGVVATQVRRHLTHLVVRIESPLREDPHIRELVERMLDNLGLPPVDSVANTIFPAGWAADVPDPEELAADYRDHYWILKKLAGSPRGTYFGRMVDYPRNDESVGDQLNVTIDKLRRSDSSESARWTSIYEINIYNEKSDGHFGLRGFPCMSHLAFHLDGELLHACAQYRNQDLVERAYGNYLGLAQLQHYVATASGLFPGELTIFIGHAFIPSGKRNRLYSVLAECDGVKT